MFREMFGSFVGLRKADYDLLDTFLNKFTIFQNVKYKRVVVSRHEENEEDPLLLVFEIELRGKKYILKVKKNGASLSPQFYWEFPFLFSLPCGRTMVPEIQSGQSLPWLDVCRAASPL